MKKIFVIILMFSYSVNAQNNLSKLDDTERIIIGKFIPDDLNIGNSSKRILDNKLNRIITNYAIGSSDPTQRFILVPSISVLTKDVTQTQPQMIAINIDVIYTIGDGINGDKFSSISFNLKGAGINDEKAYISALRRLPIKNDNLFNLFKDAKTKIIEYYNTKCDLILEQAKTKSEIKAYDESIYILSKVPDVCKECLQKANDMIIHVYNLKTKEECNKKISNSRLSLANNNFDEAAIFLSDITSDFPCYDEALVINQEIQDNKCMKSMTSAENAWIIRDFKKSANFLCEIPINSTCYNDAKKLKDKIVKKLNDEEKKKWDLEYEKYNRNQTLLESQAQNQIDIKNRSQNLLETQAQNEIDIRNRSQNLLETQAQNEMNSKSTSNMGKNPQSNNKTNEKSSFENQDYSLANSMISTARAIGMSYAKNLKKVIYHVENW
jgi:hypothetical protein